jgi:hypothetical protein
MTLRDRRRSLSSLEAGGNGINEVRRSQKERYPRSLQLARRSPDAKDPFQLLSHDDSRGSTSARQVPIEEERHLHNPNPSKRLTSISSFGPRSSSTKDIERAKPRNTKSAREIIREDVVVAGGGVKIRNVEPEGEDKGSGDYSPPSRSAPPPPPSAPSPHRRAVSSLSTPKFLKPAGVDEPSDFVSRGDGSRPARSDADTTRGARRPNLKRDRDDRRRDDAGAQNTTNAKRRKSGAAAAA